MVYAAGDAPDVLEGDCHVSDGGERGSALGLMAKHTERTREWRYEGGGGRGVSNDKAIVGPWACTPPRVTLELLNLQELHVPPPHLMRWLSALAAYSAAKRSGEKAARRGSSTMTARRICFSLLSLKRSTVSTTSLYLKVWTSV